MATRPTTRKVNRRSSAAAPRDHLLDVRIRTSTARRRNQEKLGRWIRNIVLFVCILGASVYGVRFALNRFFFENTEYTLTRITLKLDDILTREEALAECGLREGVNIFSVDLAGVERAFQAIPEVQTARVVRELPNHIQVTLTARKPVAWIAAEGVTGDPTASERSMLVDAGGLLMHPRHLSPEEFHLPVIYGVKDDNLQDGEILPNEEARLALDLIEIVESHPESLLKIRTLDVSKGYRIDVVNDTNSRIIFAASDFEAQLARLQQLLMHCSEAGRTLESVNLMVKRNTPVTFVMAVAPVLETPELPPKTTRQKTRKN